MAESKNPLPERDAEPLPLKPGIDGAMDDGSDLPSPPPHDAGYEPVKSRPPMQQDENGDDVGPGSKSHTGASGHKGR